MQETPWPRLIATALVACTVLLLEIAATRILSVVLWYHWAFFSVSTAMLGIGVPGVWWAVRGFGPNALCRALLRASWLLPLGTVGIIQLSRWFAPFSALFCFGCLLLPLLCLGTALCLLVLDAPPHLLGRLYAGDLFGACAGAVLAVPLMHLLPTPELVAALGLLPLGAHLWLEPRRWVPVAALAVAELGLLFAREPLTLHHTKAYDERWSGYRPIYERWTPYARVTIFDRVFWRPGREGFGWGQGSNRAAEVAPEQYWLEQDGSAGSPITRLRGPPSELQYLFDDVTAAGYLLRPPEIVAIIGAGGGRDILAALANGARRVDAVELNGAIVEALRGPFAQFSGNVYDLDGVETIVGDGRSVLSRSKKRYDLIQISLVDSWAATAAGAYALAENSLYTVEAYRLYWSRLSATGLVSTSRWMAGSSALEIPRLLILAKASLIAEGIPDPNAHLALLQGGEVGTVLLSRRAFSDAERLRLGELSARRGFVLHWPRVSGHVHPDFAQRILDQGPALYRPLGLVLDPPTDDRPFFFQMTSPWRRLDGEVARVTGLTTQPIATLRTSMILLSGLGLALFLGPFLRARRLVRGPGFWRGSGYFVALGCGFMLVEVAWLQRSIIYLGNASLGAATVLGSLLLGAALGAWLSSRISFATARKYGFTLAVAVLLGNAILGALAAGAWDRQDPVRIALVGAVLAPVGGLLGLAFPLGIARFRGARAAWYWALNGAAGVVAGVFSLALGIELGFSRVATLGAIAYAIGWMLWLWAPRHVDACAAP